MQKGLGRGLDALFNGSDKKEEITPQKLPIADIVPNPAQPRRNFVEQGLLELAESIRMQGILQPILVRPLADGKYQIIAGERRWRAAGLANLTLVPVIVRDINDDEAMAVALIENLQREDLNPLEEAQALAALKETLNLSQDELAGRLGKSRPAIANSIRLLQLSPQAQDDLAQGRLSAGHARCILGIAEPEAAETLRKKIVAAGMTVRESEKAAACHREEGIFPWDREEKGIKAKSPEKKLGLEAKESFARFEKMIAAKLGCGVSIKGTEKKGRISLNFSTNAELSGILESLGIAQEHSLLPD